MSAVKSILLAVAAVAVVYFAPVLIPQIGAFFGVTGFLATAIGSFVIAAGVTALQYGLNALLGGKQNTTMDAGKVNVRIAEPTRWLNAGQFRQGGGVLFAEFDASGNLWYLTVQSDSILTNAVSYYLDETLVTLDGSGNVLSKDFRLVGKKKEPAETDGAGTGYVQIWTTTYSETDPVPARIAALDGAFPSKWTSDHKLVGTTFSVVKMSALAIEDRYKLYRWRGPLGLGEPAISIVGDWSNVFDPRDGSQTNGMPTTYEFRRNPTLLWAWFRTHRYGRNKARSSVNWSRIAEQAAICDQIVTGIDGDHVRYQCDIGIPDNKERVVAEQEILMSMDAQLVFDEDGKCWPRAGQYVAPTLSLTRNRDIVAMESVEAQNGESETQGVIVRYVDPGANYTTQPSAPWYNPLYYVDGLSNTFLTVDILACQDHNQAMRLAKAIGMRSQPPHKILPTVGLRGLKARHERIINLNYDNIFAGDYEIVTPVEVDPVGIFCGFGLVPIDANRWTLLSGEEKPKPVTTEYEGVPLPALPIGVTLTYTNSRIEATFTAPTRDDVSYEFQYIKTADLASDNWLNMTVQMENNLAYSATVAQATDYSVRWRSITASGRVSAWSTNVSVNVGLSIMQSNNLTVTGGVGNATISWKNPNDLNFYFSDTWRGTTNVFSAATKIVANFAGGVGEVQSITDTTAPGTYYYWNVARANDGTSATPAGPISGVIT